MISAGADYNSASACLAVLKDKKVQYCFTSHDMDKGDHDFLWQALKSTMESMKQEYGITHIYLEDNFVSSRQRIYSGLQLTRMSAYIETAAFAVDIIPVMVMAQSWRKVVYGQGRPQDKKELARFFVKNEFGYETRFKYEHNMCEAICLAHYGNLVRSKEEAMNTESGI